VSCARAASRVAQRRQPIGRDAAPNAALARGRIRFEVLGEHAAERGERRLHRGRLGHRPVRPRPTPRPGPLRPVGGLRRRLGGGSPQSISSAAFRLRAPSNVTPAPVSTCRPRDLQRRGRTRQHRPQGAAQQIPRVLDPPRPTRGEESSAPARLPAKPAGRLGQGHRAIEQLPIQVVRDQCARETSPARLRKQRGRRGQIAQHQLPAPVHPRGDHRVASLPGHMLGAPSPWPTAPRERRGAPAADRSPLTRPGRRHRIARRGFARKKT
jgi:hypothetical protein